MKKQNKTLIRLASIFTGLVIVVTLVFVFIIVSTKTSTIEVPNVAGYELSKAITTLQDAGFTVADEQEGISSKEVEVGNVVKTSPLAGTERKKGSTIKIYVSTGDATIQIEDYTGKNYLEVKGALEARGLVVNIEEEVVDNDNEENYENGDVIRQSVEADNYLKKGENITLYVASVGITYPNFADGSYNISDVEEFCEDNNLKLEIVYTTSDTYLEGTIYKQSREEGTPVKEGASFKIYVYKNDGEVDNSDDTDIDDCEDGLC